MAAGCTGSGGGKMQSMTILSRFGEAGSRLQADALRRPPPLRGARRMISTHGTTLAKQGALNSSRILAKQACDSHLPGQCSWTSWNLKGARRRSLRRTGPGRIDHSLGVGRYAIRSRGSRGSLEPRLPEPSSHRTPLSGRRRPCPPLLRLARFEPRGKSRSMCARRKFWVAADPPGTEEIRVYPR